MHSLHCCPLPTSVVPSNTNLRFIFACVLNYEQELMCLTLHACCKCVLTIPGILRAVPIMLCVFHVYRRKDLELLNQHAEVEKEVRERLEKDGTCTCLDLICIIYTVGAV